MPGMRPQVVGGLVCAALLLSAVPAWSCASAPDGAYARVLTTYVDRAGWVDYVGLQEHRGDLDAYVAALAACDPATLRAADPATQIAFWLNAYNGLHLRIVVDNYPLGDGFFRRPFFPRNSIRQIRRVWDKFTFAVAGREVSLNDIEHEILRVEFDEPRIHMALNCASVGCPPLRREPYRGATLDTQLAVQTRRFLALDRGLQWADGGHTLRIAKLFQWFHEDFAAVAPADPPPQWPEGQAGVLAFIAAHLPPAQADRVRTHVRDVTYLDYDWTLNEQSTDKKGGAS